MEVTPEPYAPAAAELGISQDELLAQLESMQRAARAAPRGGDPVPPPRRLLRERHGRLERARGAHPRARPAHVRRSAASRTATSGPPTPTGPTPSSRWPTAARRRSATRSSTRSRPTPGSRTAARSTRRPSSRRSGCATSRTSTSGGKRSTRKRPEAAGSAGCAGSASRSAEAYERALELLPGGVNSPVRAMRAIGRDPLFVARGEGAELVDVDGNRYVDWVMSWGPLIAGHAHPEVVSAVQAAAARGHELRRADRGRGRAGGGDRRARPVRRDGAHDLVGHRGVDERHPAGAGGDRARPRSSSSRAPTTATSTACSPTRARASPRRGSRRARA